MLNYVAQRFSNSRSSIVELGALFGGSAACLAYGASSRKTGAKVFLYDLFQPPKHYIERFLTAQGYPDPGRDSSAQVRDFLKPFGSSVELRKGDILELGWSGGPISILHLDAAKSRSLTYGIAKEFLPSLIPGKSVLIVQDYLFQGHPWAVHLPYVLRRHLKLAACTALNSAIFVVTKKIPPNSPLFNEINHASDAEYIEALTNAGRSLADPQHRRKMAMSIGMIEDNPRATQVNQFPVRDFSDERLGAIGQQYGFEIGG